MIRFRMYSKSPKSKIIDTGSGIAGFDRKRKYDTSTDRLSRSSVQNEINLNGDQLNEELKKTRKELKGVL